MRKAAQLRQDTKKPGDTSLRDDDMEESDDYEVLGDVVASRHEGLEGIVF